MTTTRGIVRLRETALVLGAVALVAEPWITPPGGHLLVTLLILWPAVAGYLIVTRRLPLPTGLHLPVGLVAASLLALIIAGRAMLENRQASLLAAGGSVILWSVVAVRCRRRGRAPGGDDVVEHRDGAPR
jgi:hypothetical protein